ncbi:hypothetical protein MPTK1_8g13170 [Marchantia polymorpha subsp. ruderalis]|uniref:Uncharacterized protein n=1 Tax=Marchantia polymorpha TaxID=3197 RepID=A0A2R6WJM3_MARPO|nr:hypothetical protein MARPO_0083s0004 [Marchantia polymorpha]BBN19734.1 hypothetical protein Mp_8g13170 [Marchantia polymorpha subsp. ruderalis]|eukprot:PTQ34033.1 hypothetical protein MARPO_0083s0004 [Marchantia polymorpha]
MSGVVRVGDTKMLSGSCDAEEGELCARGLSLCCLSSMSNRRAHRPLCLPSCSTLRRPKSHVQSVRHFQ